MIYGHYTTCILPVSTKWIHLTPAFGQIFCSKRRYPWTEWQSALCTCASGVTQVPDSPTDEWHIVPSRIGIEDHVPCVQPVTPICSAKIIAIGYNIFNVAMDKTFGMYKLIATNLKSQWEWRLGAGRQEVNCLERKLSLGKIEEVFEW